MAPSSGSKLTVEAAAVVIPAKQKGTDKTGSKEKEKTTQTKRRSQKK